MTSAPAHGLLYSDLDSTGAQDLSPTQVAAVPLPLQGDGVYGLSTLHLGPASELAWHVAGSDLFAGGVVLERVARCLGPMWPLPEAGGDEGARCPGEYWLLRQSPYRRTHRRLSVHRDLSAADAMALAHEKTTDWVARVYPGAPAEPPGPAGMTLRAPNAAPPDEGDAYVALRFEKTLYAATTQWVGDPEALVRQMVELESYHQRGGITILRVTRAEPPRGKGLHLVAAPHHPEGFYFQKRQPARGELPGVSEVLAARHASQPPLLGETWRVVNLG